MISSYSPFISFALVLLHYNGFSTRLLIAPVKSHGIYLNATGREKCLVSSSLSPPSVYFFIPCVNTLLLKNVLKSVLYLKVKNGFLFTVPVVQLRETGQSCDTAVARLLLIDFVVLPRGCRFESGQDHVLIPSLLFSQRTYSRLQRNITAYKCFWMAWL